MSDEPAELTEARARAGAAIRDLGHAFIGREATIDQVERLTDAVVGITTELWPQEARKRRGEGPQSDRPELPQGRFEHDFDDRPVSGRSSPWGLDLELHRHDDEIEALVTLRSAHEGAPGRAHGGVVAALFDDVFGFVLGILRQPAFTGEITVRYRRPTPLFRPLACRVRLERQDGRKLLFAGELTDVERGEIVATASSTFIAVDPAGFAAMTAERPAPPNEPDDP